jgi:tetratricopeptide (TPR) repeat protein
MAMALIGSGQRRQAREIFLRLAASGDASKEYVARVYSALAELELYEGRGAEAVAFAERGLALFPADPQLLFAKASAHYVLNEHERAAAALVAIVNRPPGRRMRIAAAADVETKLAPRMLAAVKRMQGAFAEAEGLLAEVVRRHPGDVTSWYNLGLIYLDLHCGPALAQVVSRLAKLPGGMVEAGILSALWQMRYGDVAAAGPLIERLIAEAPQLPCPRMLRAEWLSRTRASWDEQMRALRDVLRVQPGNVEAREWMAAVEQRQMAAARAAAGVSAAAFGGAVTVGGGQPVG